MKHFIFLACLFLLSSNAFTQTQVAPLTKTSFKVLGNCEMCKATIERAAKANGVSSAQWDMQTDTLTIEFDPNRITIERVQRNIAAAGYDNDTFSGNNNAYNRLPKCCQYTRKPKE